MSGFHKNALLMGTVLADYTLEAVLGHGGFGITYLARDNALGAQVAIKEYLPEEIAGRDDRTHHVVPNPTDSAVRDYHYGLKNFVKEARALARFKHPNIVRVLRFLEANGTAYTVMEYETGKTLVQLLKDDGKKLPETALLRIIIPILNGLHAVHEAGMLHLDIKPDNIYLRADGSPMLIDFGSARQAISAGSQQGAMALTPGYAPYEQYPNQGTPGPAADIYAVGATMYRCISGQRPSDALDRYRAVQDYQADPVKPVALSIKEKYQPLVLECVDWAMKIHANDRPQSARALQDRLMGKNRPVTRSGASFANTGNTGRARLQESRMVERPPPSRWPKPRERRSGWVGATAVIGLVALALGSAYYLGWLDVPDVVTQVIDAPIKITSPNNAQATATPVAPMPNESSRLATTIPIPKTPNPKASAVDKREARTTRLASVPMAARTLGSHNDWVQALAFAPNGNQLVSAGQDNVLRVWDPTSGALIRTIGGYRHAFNAVSYSSDGQRFASAGVDGVVRLWDARTGKLQSEFVTAGQSLNGVAFAPDGHLLAAAGKDRIVYVWDVASRRRHTLEGHTGEIFALAFSPNGRRLVTAGADRLIWLWDIASDGRSTTLTGHSDTIFALALSPDGRTLVSGDAGGRLRVWDLGRPVFVRAFGDADRGTVLALGIAPDGSWLAAGSANGGVYLYDVATGNLLQSLSGHRDYVQAIAVTRDALASGGRDRTVRLWRSAVSISQFANQAR